MENRLVYCLAPEVEENSLRFKPEIGFYVYPEGTEENVDFTSVKNIEGVIDILSALNSCGVHLMGSRGYVYHTGEIAKYLSESLEKDTPIYYLCIPRVCGLRKAVILFDQGRRNSLEKG